MKKLIADNFENYVKDLETLIEVPSVIKDGDVYPNIESMSVVLDKTMEIATKLGFSIYRDSENYYGYAEIGEGELFGVLGHLDVVPAGDLEAWETNPFELVRKDGKLIGRGTQDDKGPMLAAMYGLKALLDSGHKLTKRVRFIFGTDEETAWRGINKYLEKKETPSFGFTPDADFPLIYAEKGILEVKLVGKSSGINFRGGDATNSVPSKVKYTLDNQDEFIKSLEEHGFEYNDKLEVIGKSVHALASDQGINSIVRTFIAMEKMYPNSDAIKFVCNTFREDANATSIVGKVFDEPTGKLMFNLGKFEFNENSEELFINIRIPVLIDKDEIVEKIKASAAKYNLEYIETGWKAPLYLPKDSELIVNLMSAYREVTGDYETPEGTTGGGTYARAISNCVAFGPLLPNGAATEHQPNEYVDEEEMKIAIEIYAKAFEKLA